MVIESMIISVKKKMDFILVKLMDVSWGIALLVN